MGGLRGCAAAGADDISTSPFEKTDTRRDGAASLPTTTKPTLGARGHDSAAPRSAYGREADVAA